MLGRRIKNVFGSQKIGPGRALKILNSVPRGSVLRCAVPKSQSVPSPGPAVGQMFITRGSTVDRALALAHVRPPQRQPHELEQNYYLSELASSSLKGVWEAG